MMKPLIDMLRVALTVFILLCELLAGHEEEPGGPKRPRMPDQTKVMAQVSTASLSGTVVPVWPDFTRRG